MIITQAYSIPSHTSYTELRGDSHTKSHIPNDTSKTISTRTDKQNGRHRLSIAHTCRRLLRSCKASRFYRPVTFGFYALLCIGAISFISSLNIFYIETIIVEPFSDDSFTYITEERVQKHLLPYVGKRFFSVGPGEIHEHLINHEPFIFHAYITKRFPNTIVVRLTERLPSVVLDSSPSAIDNLNGVVTSSYQNAIVVDSHGFILQYCKDDSEICSRIPHCATEYSWETYQPGDTLYFVELAGIVNVHELFTRGKYDVLKYAVPQEDVVVVEMANGSRVIFSISDDINDQFRSFEYTAENLSLEGTKYKEIDLRFERPVIRVDKYTEWVTE